MLALQRCEEQSKSSTDDGSDSTTNDGEEASVEGEENDNSKSNNARGEDETMTHDDEA